MQRETISKSGLPALLASIAIATSTTTLAGISGNSVDYDLGVPEQRERIDFNRGWRFARFGIMPDGSAKPEPGAERRLIQATASSSETEKGNLPANAVDEDPATRWCAADGSREQWLALDLRQLQSLSAIEIEWETDLAYRYAIERSQDGKSWQEVAAHKTPSQDSVEKVPVMKTPFLRIRTLELPEMKWASIKEVVLYDKNGEVVQNELVEPREAPSMPGFDDTAWRTLSLPHDWGIEGPFRPELPNQTGKLPWVGIGWYRKHFKIPGKDRGRKIFFDVDGAMSHAKVFVNGKEAGGWPYGYNSFRIDMTPFIAFGQDNCLAVRLDNPPDSSRWYPGGGIYRNTWLVKTAPTHFARGGVFVKTPQVSADRALIEVKLEIAGATDGCRAQGLLFSLGAGGNGKPELIMKTNAVEVGQDGKATSIFAVDQPRLWSLEDPALYCLLMRIESGGETVDTLKTVFGIRSIEFEPGRGFLLNGELVELKGVCDHHDLGPLGAAFYIRGMERKLELLKEMGCNSIRTAHNMPAPEVLGLADRMGFLVIDEAFDCWARGKTRNDYGTLFKDWHERDLRSFVRRDRNHPSVIMWSTGNEIREQGGKAGHEISRRLTQIIKQEDPTRPVTAGCNNLQAGFNGFEKTVDVFGYNYKPHKYGQFRSEHPNIPLYGSETASTVSSRGEYFFPVVDDKSKGVADFHVSSYDLSAPPWAYRPDIEFEAQDRHPAALGEYVWTGFDYIGEPTPYNKDSTNLLNFQSEAARERARRMMEALGDTVPPRSSYFGIFDLCGFKKDRFYIYQARWRPELPMAHILPHWNWPGRVGEVTPVHVYTSGDEAELFLNGKSLGRRRKGEFEYRLRWNDVVYHPGELRVVAYRQGQRWAEAVRATSGDPVELEIEPDRREITADGYDLAYVTVSVRDGKGRVVPNADNPIEFELEGPGDIVAVGNGDQTSHEPFQAVSRLAFNGYCLVIVRSRPNSEGVITLRARSKGLSADSSEIRAKGILKETEGRDGQNQDQRTQGKCG